MPVFERKKIACANGEQLTNIRSGVNGFTTAEAGRFGTLVQGSGICFEGQDRLNAIADFSEPHLIDGTTLGELKAEAELIKQEANNAIEAHGLMKTAATLDHKVQKSWCQMRAHQSQMLANQFENKHELAQAVLEDYGKTHLMQAATGDKVNQLEAIRSKLQANKQLLFA